MIISSSIFTVSSFAKAHETIGVTNSDAPKESYTYWEDYSSTDKTMAYSKPMYSAELVINSSNLGTEPFNDIKDICSDEFNNVYLLKEEKENGRKILSILKEYGLEDKPYICNKKRKDEYEVIAFSKKLINMNIYLNVWTYSIEMEAIDAEYSFDINQSELFELNININHNDKVKIKTNNQEVILFLKSTIAKAIN